MKKEYADKWVAALRSGKYEQGIGILRTPEGAYCCLGVLCTLDASLKWSGDNRCDGSYLSLSSKAKDLFGLVGTGHEGGFDPYRVKWPESISLKHRKKGCLSSLNDAGVPFSAIADFIELNYEVL